MATTIATRTNHSRVHSAMLAEFDALAADADARGVLNYYNINRGARAPYYERGDEPQEMSKADICNVEFISARDLDDVFDGIIEAASYQHALEDCECRWNIADVDTDLMDLGAPPAAKPFKSKRDVVPFRSKLK